MKKKIITILVLLLGVILMPWVVKADMAAPAIESYKVMVSNAAGANIYSESNKDSEVIGTIANGTIIEITYEEADEETGEIYGTFYPENSESYASIKLSDVVAVKSFVEPEKSNYFKETRKIMVVNGGIFLRSGPGTAYKNVSQAIPEKTILEYNYADFDGGWIYTNYAGVNGWIMISGMYHYYDIATSCTMWGGNCGEKNIMTMAELYLYSSPQLTAEKLFPKAIPIYTKLLYEYEYSEGWNKWVYVTYKGTTGWILKENNSINTQNLANDYITNILTIEAVKLYSTPFDNSTDSIKTVPANTELDVSYEFYNNLENNDDEDYNDRYWYYVKYNNNYYWLHYNSESKEYKSIANIAFQFSDEYEDEEYLISEIKDEKTYLFANPSLDSKKIFTEEIPVGTKLSIRYCITNLYNEDTEDSEAWYFVSYKGKVGWIFDPKSKLAEVAATDYYNAFQAVEKAESSKSKVDVNNAFDLVEKLSVGADKEILLNRLKNIKVVQEVAKLKPKQEASHKISDKEIIYYSVGGAVVIALGALVTIKLINKKKKAKNSTKEPDIQAPDIEKKD